MKHLATKQEKLKYALEKLEKGEFTLSKASEFAEMDVFSFAKEIKSKKKNERHSSWNERRKDAGRFLIIPSP